MEDKRLPAEWVKMISSTCRHQCLPENSTPPYEWEQLFIPVIRADGTWVLEDTGKSRQAQ